MGITDFSRLVRGCINAQVGQRRQYVSQKLPLPPFTNKSAVEKVRIAEDAWNSKNPVQVSMAYTEDCWWRNRSQFIKGFCF